MLKPLPFALRLVVVNLRFFSLIDIVQHEMLLSDQPSLGAYTINLNMTETGIMSSRVFRVDEFGNYQPTIILNRQG